MAKLAKTVNQPQLSVTATCSWNTTFTVNPSDVECVLTYCANGTGLPINNVNNFVSVVKEGGGNYDIQNGEVIELGKTLKYNCKDGHRLQNDTDNKGQADDFIRVTCSNGNFIYPDPWPECVRTIQCKDPGSNVELVRKEKNNFNNHTYEDKLEYSCLDQRSYIKVNGSSKAFAPSIVSTCEWRQIYDVDVNKLICKIDHCGHPHSGNGSHPAPPPEYNISLVETDPTRNKYVPFGYNVMYKCDANTFIENEEIDPTKTNITVQCQTDTGIYLIPNAWPNCTETVTCGPPPSPPEGGTIIWMNGTENEVNFRLPKLTNKLFR